MHTMKKALSLILVTVMLFTTFCFFPLDLAVKSNAEMLDNDIAFYTPEVIYLYPNATAWRDATVSPFQYYIGNTVDTDNIYNAPVVNQNAETEGKIYFAATENVADVELSAKFVASNMQYLGNANNIEYTYEDKGTYHLFTVTKGMSPALAASENGCFIEWCVSFENEKGEKKSALSYSYIYKPYTVPYGGAIRTENENGNNNFSQHIAWVSGVHSINTNVSDANAKLYPQFSELDAANKGFASFLSAENKAYFGSSEVSGIPTNGNMNAVFASTDENFRYFYAGQSGSPISGNRVTDWLKVAQAATATTYNIPSFDYNYYVANGSPIVQSSVAVGQEGYIAIDTSRYSNLNEIPNLGVGLLATDIDNSDKGSWYVADATDVAFRDTGDYKVDTEHYGAYNEIIASQGAKSLDSMSADYIKTGIIYGGAWNKAIDKTVNEKMYTVKTYLGTSDVENDVAMGHVMIDLNTKNYDKSAVRSAVNKVTSKLSVLGLQDDWTSVYYDSTSSAWTQFVYYYQIALMQLTRIDAESQELVIQNLEYYLSLLLSGVALKVNFETGEDAQQIDSVILTSASYGTLPSPTRTGYTFDGWYTDEELTTPVEIDNVTVNTLYAKWESNFYKITFTNLNKTEEYKYSDGIYGTLPEATLEGRTFGGWITADGEYITENTPIKATDITVTAIWVNNPYTVHFSAGSGIGTMSSIKAEYETAFNLPQNTFTKTGYTFAGWATEENGEVKYANKASVINLTSEVNGEVTLYAVFTPNTFTAVLNANGTEGENINVNVTYDSGVSLPECTFSKTGFSFLGWSLEKDGDVLSADEYDNLCTENGESVDLFALWEENSYTIYYNGNSGEGYAVSQTQKYSENIVLSDSHFKKTGYTVSGWALTPDGEKAYEHNQIVSELCYDKDGEITLYAVWTANTYEVLFDGNTGVGEMNAFTATYDESFSLPENTFTKEGYHFLGWATEENGKAEYSDKQTLINVLKKGAITLYAVWDINVYNVTLTFLDKTGKSVTMTVPVKHGEDVELPSEFFAFPMKANDKTQHYIFSSWGVPLENVTKDFSSTALYDVDAHVMAEKISVPAKCDIDGVKTHYCTRCAYSYDETIPMTKHEWNDGERTKEPTCTVPGTFTKTCTKCFATSESDITALGHEFTEFAKVEPKCSEEGKIAHKHCSRCEKCFAADANKNTPDSEALTDEQIKIAKLPHTPGDDATCTAPQKCTVCQQVIMEALGHKEATKYETTEATCVKEGNYTEIVYCMVCLQQLSSTQKVGTIPHNYSSSVTAPDCENEGYTTYTCSVCFGSYTDNKVPALGHTAGEWRETTAPTCEDKGEETHYCSVCQKGYETRDVKAVGHTSGEWKVTIEPTCDEAGQETHYCSVCLKGYETREKAPLGHIAGEWVEIKAPKCEETGEKVKYCTVCENLVDSSVISASGHTLSADATCTTDKICTVCNEVFEKAFGHLWNDGVVIKPATTTEEGEKLFTCTHDNTHTRIETIPKRVIIAVPELSEGEYVEIRADENSNGGSIFDIITVESGVTVRFSSSVPAVLVIDTKGNITATQDGDATITVKAPAEGIEVTFPVKVLTLKTVTFDINGVVSTQKLYVGDTPEIPEVNSYVDEEGFSHTFKVWTKDGVEVSDFTVTGDSSYVAVFTKSCDYTELDRLTALFNDLITGDWNNKQLLIVYSEQIAGMKEKINEFAENREIRDSSEQYKINEAARALEGLITLISPDVGASLEIVGDFTECKAGNAIPIKAIKNPIGTQAVYGVWSTSDPAIGFVSDGMFHATGIGTVRIYVSSGDLSTGIEITVTSGAAARVLQFEALISGIVFVIEGQYKISTTTNLFWAPDDDLSFRIETPNYFKDYYIYFNGEIVEPDSDGTYVIPAGSGDIHIATSGIIEEEDGTKLSFWEQIIAFFKRIADFFANLFK